jgi:hypothetical protein
MKIIIESIPHDKQRYDTVGDYWEETDAAGNITWHIKVSDTGDLGEIVAIALHELIEKTLCKFDGVTDAQIDAFDFNWKGDGEPGDSHGAPYHEQHKVATYLESDFVSWLGRSWGEYTERLDCFADGKPVRPYSLVMPRYLQKT